MEKNNISNETFRFGQPTFSKEMPKSKYEKKRMNKKKYDSLTMCLLYVPYIL